MKHSSAVSDFMIGDRTFIPEKIVILKISKPDKMRLKLFLLLAFVPALVCTAKPEGLSGITVMSYNIRSGEASDGTNSWQFRFPATAMMIEDQKPDILGIQEAMQYQLLFITENCRDYKYAGAGSEDGKSKGEHTAILYNKKTTSLLKWGTFWLSDTPDKPSKGWDSSAARTATWALMKNKETGKKFYFINVHLDDEGDTARLKGLGLVMSRIGELNSDRLPVILAGCFNAGVPALVSLEGMKNARQIAARTDSNATFNGWGKSSSVIDHIFYSGFRSCTDFETVVKPYADRKFISDHYPVKAVLVF